MRDFYEVLLLISSKALQNLDNLTDKETVGRLKNFLQDADKHDVDSNTGDHLYHWNKVYWHLDFELGLDIDYFTTNTSDSEYLFLVICKDDAYLIGTRCRNQLLIQSLINIKK